jgi:hypothetical protein
MKVPDWSSSTDTACLENITPAYAALLAWMKHAENAAITVMIHIRFNNHRNSSDQLDWQDARVVFRESISIVWLLLRITTSITGLRPVMRPFSTRHRPQFRCMRLFVVVETQLPCSLNAFRYSSRAFLRHSCGIETVQSPNFLSLMGHFPVSMNSL